MNNGHCSLVDWSRNGDDSNNANIKNKERQKMHISTKEQLHSRPPYIIIALNMSKSSSVLVTPLDSGTRAAPLHCRSHCCLVCTGRLLTIRTALWTALNSLL
ncbi:hypothetical protein E2C01_076365 [Portunus trituberculatus]|uniref:Uncharacterized protein n=1 Tax=Portunus trituberculatus TaxID=210409 RepID=A0A5B7INC9_PORTR|nr:hypothetical protein [Portunus trituberculatus]